MTEYIENPLSGKLRGVTYEDGKIIAVYIRDTDDTVKVFVPMASEKEATGMMDIREKLVELLGNIYLPMMDGRNTIGEYNIPHKFKEKIADYLISNGVTVQAWISVDDRLPKIPEGLEESPEPVLYMMKNTKTIYAGYYGEGGVWRDKYFRQYSDSRNGVDADDVTCWMYQCDLPNPPKGE